MNRTGQIIVTSIIQALQELRVNKLRTFLSLLGITIGIFCIIAVRTVLDSMRNNIEVQMASLGSDVLYIGRWPWMDEGGEYKWWEFLRRPSMGPKELDAVQSDVKNIEYATLMYRDNGLTVKYTDQELSGIHGYAVTNYFDKLQNLDIAKGRYLSMAEIDGGNNSIVLGAEVSSELFPGGIDPIGKKITFHGRGFYVVGVMAKSGQSISGINLDRGIIYPYYMAANIMDVKSLNSDPTLMVKTAPGVNVDDAQLEVEGALRRIRKVRPGEKNNFAVNKLSQITARLDMMFEGINMIGWAITILALLVGMFGIANIMFVTVKERTKVIGLKKAIGAKPKSILLEFLVEAVTLCITGGLIGIILVLILSLILTYAANFPVTLSFFNIAMGVTISAIVGVLAGFIPARSASRLDPVTAIRSH